MRPVPAVTVIIPTRDRPRFLARALDCVARQTYRDFETIIVDDGSAEPVAVASRRRAIPGLRVLRHETDRGAAAARNTGIGEARGRFLAFLDDDDVWLPEKLAKQVARLEDLSEEVGAVVCGYRVFSEMSGSVFRTIVAAGHPRTPIEFLQKTGFMTSIPLIRRLCFDEVGLFDEGLPGTQDKDMWIRIAERFSFESVPDVLAVHHIHGNQITTDLEAKIEAKKGILRKHEKHLEGRPEALAALLERIGIFYCVKGEMEAGRGYYLEALRAWPERRGTYGHVARSCGDPEEYRRYILEEILPSVDGVTLFY